MRTGVEEGPGGDKPGPSLSRVRKETRDGLRLSSSIMFESGQPPSCFAVGATLITFKIQFGSEAERAQGDVGSDSQGGISLESF